MIPRKSTKIGHKRFNQWRFWSFWSIGVWSLEFIYLEKIQIAGRRVFVSRCTQGCCASTSGVFFEHTGVYLEIFPSLPLESDAWKTIRASFLGLALRLPTPPMETPDPASDTPGASKQVATWHPMTSQGVLGWVSFQVQIVWKKNADSFGSVQMRATFFHVHFRTTRKLIMGT